MLCACEPRRLQQAAEQQPYLLEAGFQYIPSHASPGRVHIPGGSLSPVEKPTGSALPGLRILASMPACAAGAVSGEMAGVAQVTPLP